ncbi:AAA family ATPase [Candidatus Dependentiae bacterium]|nr:AAA family ATPase [Candidatus Dependentiae bacterium]
MNYTKIRKYLIIVLLFTAALPIQCMDPFWESPLINETSLVSLPRKFWNWIAGIKKESKPITTIFAEKISEQINIIAEELENTAHNKHYLLWGPPGTGKTMLAKQLAVQCNREYIFVNATSFCSNTLPEALKNISDLFEYARNNKAILFIDDIDNVFKESNPLACTMIIDHILSFITTSSRYCTSIFISDTRALKESLLNAIDKKLYIGIPEAKERAALIKMYIDKYLVKGQHLQNKPTGLEDYFFTTPDPVVKVTIQEDVFSDEHRDYLTKILDGFNGRDISKLVLGMLNAAYATEDSTLTWAMIEQLVQKKLDELKS